MTPHTPEPAQAAIPYGPARRPAPRPEDGIP